MGNEQLNNRLKSLAWRVGMMIVAAGLSFIIENETILNIPSYATVLAGLVLGEISKYLNTEYQIRSELENLNQ